MSFRRTLFSCLLIIGASVLFIFEALAVPMIGRALGWSSVTVLSVLCALAVITLFAVIKLKRKYTVETPRTPSTQFSLKEIRSFSLFQWFGLAIAITGMLIALGNRTGIFLTFPFFGGILITIGVTIFAVAKSKA